jgi:ATP phosphoribosyltransferase
MLRFALPNGSLKDRLRMYLRKAGYDIGHPDRRGNCGIYNAVEFWERDRRMIPKLIRNGTFDAGITGRDLILDCDAQDDVRTVADLCFSRNTDEPARWVLAYNPVQFPLLSEGSRSATNIARVGCELSTFAAKLGSTPAMVHSGFVYRDFVRLEGYEEAAIMDGLCDVVIVVTETGSTLRQLGLQIVPGCECLFVSTPQIIARQQLSAEKEVILQQFRLALEAAVRGL